MGTIVFDYIAKGTDRRHSGRASIDISAYPDLDPFFEDLAAVYQAELADLYAAGCRFVQLDDTNLAYLCDPEMRKAAEQERKEDLSVLPRKYAALINAAISKKPADMKIGIHLCRGNYRSKWFASGGYEPVAEVLFKELNVDAYFLEVSSNLLFRKMDITKRTSTTMQGVAISHR